MNTTLTLKHAGGTGRGFVLFGNTGTFDARKWLERWFPTAEKAGAYAARRGYTVLRVPS